MLKDATYDLMETITVLSKGLHRYDTFKHDAANCRRCQEIWDVMRKQDEQQLNRLLAHLREHMQHEDAGARVQAA